MASFTLRSLCPWDITSNVARLCSVQSVGRETSDGVAAAAVRTLVKKKKRERVRK
jgi:hypothetical protein